MIIACIRLSSKLKCIRVYDLKSNNYNFNLYVTRRIDGMIWRSCMKECIDHFNIWFLYMAHLNDFFLYLNLRGHFFKTTSFLYIHLFLVIEDINLITNQAWTVGLSCLLVGLMYSITNFQFA
jgi:hypothetical protein